MNKKQALDAAIIAACATELVLSYTYLQNETERYIGMALIGLVLLCAVVLLFRDRSGENRIPGGKKAPMSELLLLNEQMDVSAVWDIYGRTSIVLGKDEGENQVDVSLKNTDYAGTVDREHAVMNYCNGEWYIEDLDSENGTRIQRGGEGKKYRVSSREPCKITRGDVIYVGLAPIRIQ